MWLLSIKRLVEMLRHRWSPHARRGLLPCRTSRAFCAVDYRRLECGDERRRRSLPRIDETIDQLEARWVSAISRLATGPSHLKLSDRERRLLPQVDYTEVLTNAAWNASLANFLTVHGLVLRGDCHGGPSSILDDFVVYSKNI
jgi:hypothetical protein